MSWSKLMLFVYSFKRHLSSLISTQFGWYWIVPRLKFIMYFRVLLLIKRSENNARSDIYAQTDCTLKKWRFPEPSKKVSQDLIKTLLNFNVSARLYKKNHKNFFWYAKPKKTFCCWVAQKPQRVLPKFYRFFKTLDAFGCFCIFTEPFLRVRQTSFIFFQSICIVALTISSLQ